MITILTPEAAGFERTVCACDACVRCCDQGSGLIAPYQLPWFRAHHADKLRRGLPVIMGSTTRDVVHVTPSIVLSAPPCPFFVERRCTIHADAPFGCAYYDPHQPHAEGDRRTTWGQFAVEADAEYIQFAETLPYRATKTDAQRALLSVLRAPAHLRKSTARALRPILETIDFDQLEKELRERR